MVFWKSDTVAADHGNLEAAFSPIHVFTNSNVVGGGFVYGSSLKHAAHSRCEMK